MNNVKVTMDTAKKAFSEGNLRGEGYAPYTDVPGPNTMSAAIEAANDDGWETILSPLTEDEIYVLHQDGSYVGIGNIYGPWAVILDMEAE